MAKKNLIFVSTKEAHKNKHQNKVTNHKNNNYYNKLTMSNTINNNNAVAVPTGGPHDHVKKVKQGHSFLFCLCDMKITVLTLDIFAFLGATMALMGVIYMDRTMSQDDIEEAFQDNKSIVNQVFYNKGSAPSGSLDPLMVLVAVAMMVHLGGIVGASNFYMCPIVIEIMWISAYTVLMGLAHNWIALGSCVFFLYPRVVLCYELAKGIMTRDNYKNQERQCCCSC